jgi:peroxiredoxin
MRAPALSVVALAAALAAGSAGAQPVKRLDIGATAPAFSLPGADGDSHHLADFAGQVVVLEWTSPVCPFTTAKYRSGAIQALQRLATSQGAVWLSVDTAAPGRPGHLTAPAARARIARLHARPTAFLFDEAGSVGRAYGAKVTPSFFIVGRDGTLAYEGAMDEEAPRGPNANYVAAALDQLHGGAPVTVKETRPYGCALEY